MNKATVYLIPVGLHDDASAEEVLTADGIQRIHTLRKFAVENDKTARHFLKKCKLQHALQELELVPIGKHAEQTDEAVIKKWLNEGESFGVLSEAGCPGVADPGASVVELAHRVNALVVPLIGPSSILLALMGSGMNGQHFKFHGYLPIDKADRLKALKQIEFEIQKFGSTHLFIETPFRNKQLLETLFQGLSGDVALCIALNLTAPNAMLKTKTIRDWKQSQLPEIHKVPAVFLLGRSTR